MSRFLILSAAMVVFGACGSSMMTPMPVTNCTATTDCNQGRVCSQGTCILAGSVQQGGSCSATRDCVDGLYCGAATAACSPAGSALQDQNCTIDGDCAAGLRCLYNGLGGRCEPGGAGDVGDTCSVQGDCLAGLFCGGAVTKTCQQYITAFPVWGGVICQSDSRPFRSYFEVPRPSKPPADFLRLPYPNDIRVSTQAGKKVVDLSDFPDPGPDAADVDLVKLYTDALAAEFEGFSSTAHISFRFTSEIQFDSVADNLQMWDLTANARVLSLSYDYTGQRTNYSCAPMVAVQPGLDNIPLLPNHQYVVFLMNGLKAMDGTTVATVDDDLAAVLATTRPASDASLQHAWDVYQPFRDFLASGQGVTTDKIINAAVFTVQDTTGHMKRLAAADELIGPPAITMLTTCGAGVAGPCGTDTAHACGSDPAFIELQGKFTVPIYQAGTPPYLTPANGGNIVEDATGVPQKVRDEEVCFSLSLPTGTSPTGGWPLMVYAHGTGGSMRDYITTGIAKQMATATTPSAVFSFDEVEHYARRGTSMANPNDLVFNALNPQAARDNILQGASDILTAFKIPLSAAPNGGTGRAFNLNPDKVSFFGHSQGSDHGQLAVAFSDAAPAVILSGAGSELLQSLLAKTNPVSISHAMQFLLSDVHLAEYHPALILFQTYFERADGVNYGVLFNRDIPEGLHGKAVYMSWGKGDSYSPPVTLQWTADSIGLAPVMPVIENPTELWVPPVMRPVTVPAVFQYTPAAGKDGHFVATDLPAAVADWTAFIESWLTTGSTNVP
jgi:hypothetical protein